MDWNGNLRVPFVSRNDNSVSYLYNYNYHDQFSGLEIKHAPSQENQMVPSVMEKSASGSYGHDSKKKRLSNEQLECLENCFQDEIKLDPDRKMKLAKELGLQPRQIAVWFQNRRARWKGKKLEQLYDELKQEFDAVNREKHKLQQEVLALRAVLNSMAKKQISIGYTEVTGEETAESTAIPSFDKRRGTNNILHQVGDCNYPMNMDGYDQVMMNQPYWAVLPSST